MAQEQYLEELFDKEHDAHALIAHLIANADETPDDPTESEDTDDNA